MKRGVYIASILITLFMVSCSSVERKTLNRVSAIIDTQPDSALTLLNTVYPEKLSRSADLASYALLKSLALDKNYIDVTDDSLISLAVHFYSRGNHPKEYMKASYVQGLIYKNGRRFTASISAMERAENLALLVDDYHYLGLIDRNIGNVFNMCNNNVSAIEYHKKAIEAFEKNNEKRYADYAKYSLAVDYYNTSQFNKAEPLLNYLIQNSGESSLLALSYLRYANILVQKNDSLQLADLYFRSVPAQYYSFWDYGCFALNQHLLGVGKDSVDSWVQKGYNKCSSQADSASLAYIESYIKAQRGDFKAAYYDVSKSSSVQDSLTRVLLGESLSQAQKDFYKQEVLLEKERGQRRRLSFIILSIVLLALIAIIILISTLHSQKKDLLLKGSLARLNVSQKLNGTLTGAYCYERLARLKTLAGSFFSAEDKAEQIQVLSSIKANAVAIQQSQQFFSQLEKELNNNCNDIVNKLRSQVPAIHGDNLKIAMLFFAGFREDLVMIIMSRPSVGSLKTLRSRLRDTIRKTNCQDKQLFLELLSVK